MAQKSESKLIAEMIARLRTKCREVSEKRLFDAAQSGDSIEAEHEAFRTAANALQSFEEYMIPDSGDEKHAGRKS